MTRIYLEIYVLIRLIKVSSNPCSEYMEGLGLGDLVHLITVHKVGGN